MLMCRFSHPERLPDNRFFLLRPFERFYFYSRAIAAIGGGRTWDQR